MATKKLSEKASAIIARAAIDPKFRDALGQDPDSVLHSVGPNLTAADVTAIKGLKPADWANMSVKDLNKRLGQVASWKVSSIES